MTTEQAQALEPYTDLRIASTELAEEAYGVHAGQVVWNVDSLREDGYWVLVECSDEHVFPVRPADLELVKP